ncbi:MAG: hypothetical protein ACREMQ_04425 [Longimicrobiales bacterium]
MRVRDLVISCFVVLAAATSVAAQQTGNGRLMSAEATPIGALPPLAMPMPASRSHNYWGLRFQAGHRIGRDGDDVLSLAGGLDLQWRGGSIFGATAGYQQHLCDPIVGEDCEAHLLLGLRGRFNIITSGPSLGAMFNDYSANTTIAAELGFGIAPSVAPNANACTIDIGLPLSISFLQRVRLVPFLTPGYVWDVDCSSGGLANGGRFFTGFGIGLQQLAARGLDVHLAFQKIFESDTGFQFGLSVMYVRLR